jgi:hypothetical protein
LLSLFSMCATRWRCAELIFAMTSGRVTPLIYVVPPNPLQSSSTGEILHLATNIKSIQNRRWPLPYQAYSRQPPKCVRGTCGQVRYEGRGDGENSGSLGNYKAHRGTYNKFHSLPPFSIC